MPKQKTKKALYDTVCTEVKLGVWQWTHEGHTWQRADSLGINTFYVRQEGELIPTIFTKNLDIAIAFSWGFRAGIGFGSK